MSTKLGAIHADGWGPPVNPEARKTLVKAVFGKTTFDYLYDFGDSWDYRIKVEKGYLPSRPLSCRIALKVPMLVRRKT